jgi:hypothetical protein
LRRRVATTVHVGHVDPARFKISTVPEEGIDKGTIQPVSEKSSDKLWTLPSTPKGFVHVGRFFVALPSGATANPIPNQGQTPPVSSLTDVYTDGADLVVVDQDPSLEAAAAAENQETYPVTINGLKRAVLVIDARESEVRAETPDGSFVRVAGTLPASRLLRLARSLRLSGG